MESPRRKEEKNTAAEIPATATAAATGATAGASASEDTRKAGKTAEAATRAKLAVDAAAATHAGRHWRVKIRQQLRHLIRVGILQLENLQRRHRV